MSRPPNQSTSFRSWPGLDQRPDSNQSEIPVQEAAVISYREISSLQHSSLATNTGQSCCVCGRLGAVNQRVNKWTTQSTCSTGQGQNRICCNPCVCTSDALCVDLYQTHHSPHVSTVQCVFFAYFNKSKESIVRIERQPGKYAHVRPLADTAWPLHSLHYNCCCCC